MFYFCWNLFSFFDDTTYSLTQESEKERVEKLFSRNSQQNFFKNFEEKEREKEKERVRERERERVFDWVKKENLRAKERLYYILVVFQ